MKYKKIYALMIEIVILLLFSIDINMTNIPELEIYNNQILKLLVPSKKCKLSSDKTLFLFSNIRNVSEEIIKKYKIIEYKNKLNSFITYYMDDDEYKLYEDLFFSQGIIRSDCIYSDNNFFITRRITNLIKNKKQLLRINKFKKFNHLYNFQIFYKDTLYMNYNEMKKIFKEEYNFMAETYNYPIDKDVIEKKFINYTLDINDLWLVKPKNACWGFGIYILDSLRKITKNEFLISKYITNLDLINNKKYDLRLHVLVSGLKPLRIYLNKEFIVRIATKDFSLNIKNIKNKYIHLTNTGLNLNNEGFINPNDTNIENSNMWDTKTYSNHLINKNIDFNKINDKIKDIIIKSIISVYKNLTLEENQNNLNDINFYEILGYDIIIKDDYEPILLEINDSPTVVYHNKIDKLIKTNLVIDTLNIVGISLFRKIFFLKNIQKYKNNSVEYNANNALCELTRPKGDYELIFPLKTNIKIYKKYFRNINTKENQLFWEILLKDF